MATSKGYLYPKVRLGASPDLTYDANDTGGWSNTDPTAIDDPQRAPDHSDYIIAPLGPSAGYQDRFFWVSYELDQPTPGVAINKVTVRDWFGSHSLNNVPVDAELEAFLIIGGTRYMHGGPVTVFGSQGFVGFAPEEHLWEWSVNPDTSLAFTVDDLAPGAIQIGLRFRALTDPQGANNPEARTSQLHLEYEYVSTAANVEQVRHVLTSELRRKRLPIKTVQVECSIQYGDVEVGQPIWLAHRKVPGPDGLGSGVEPANRAPFIVLRKQPRLTQRKWLLTLLDPVPFACTYWCPAVTDIGSDVDDRGIARLDRGGGESHARAQTGYVKRPPDGLWTDRLANTPRYFKDFGLAVCGGGQIWHANNTFSQGTGNAFTGWTVTANGAATVVEDTADILFDLLGLKRSVKITNGATPATDNGWVSRTEAVEANRHVRPFMKYKTDASGDNRPRVRVVRSIDSWEWNGTAWAAPANQWRLPNSMGIAARGPDSPGERVDYWSENIPVGAGATNITAYFGKSDGADVVTNIDAAGFTKSASGIAQTFARDFLVTTTTELTQEPDRPTINNDPGFRVLNGLRGTVTFEFVPRFEDTDLIVGTRKSLYQGAWDVAGTGGAPLQFHVGYYIKDSATESRIVFAGQIVGGDTWTAQLTLTGDQRAQYLRAMKVGFRWTSNLGELGLPVRTLTVFCNGQQSDSESADEMETTTLGSRIYFRILSVNGGATVDTEAEAADGWFRNIEFRNWALRDEQVLRTLG